MTLASYLALALAVFILALTPGPRLGGVIEALLDRVIADPALNERGSLLLLAQGILADMDQDAADPS